MSQFNEYSTIKQVAIRSAANAFVSEVILAEQWQALRFHAKPDLAEAISEYKDFRALLSSTGANLIELSSSDSLTIDSIYTRDSILVSPKGLILCNMGRASWRVPYCIESSPWG